LVKGFDILKAFNDLERTFRHFVIFVDLWCMESSYFQYNGQAAGEKM